MAMWKCNGKRQKERKSRKYSLAYLSYTDSAVPSAEYRLMSNKATKIKFLYEALSSNFNSLST